MRSLFILALLSLIIAASEWLVRRGVFRHVGSALMVIVLGAIAANAGVIPAGSTVEAPTPAYDAIFGFAAPISIFWLLLAVNLREVVKVGLPVVALFLFGSLGTLVGAVFSMWVVGGAETMGPLYHAIAGMFAATYIGGSINFNAIALHYEVMRDGALFGGTIVVDNIATTIWMAATLAIPRALAAVWPRRGHGRRAGNAAPIVEIAAETETIDPRKLAVVLALGGGAFWVSDLLAAALARAGIVVPTILIITTLALVLAQIPAVSRLPGARVMGMYGVYLFLTVVGAFCDFRALPGLGALGASMLVFASMTVLIHGILIFGAAALLRMDLDAAAVASQANVGGSTSALALAKSLGREDLLVPGILMGSVGNAIGTFLGFLAANLVGQV